MSWNAISNLTARAYTYKNFSKQLIPINFDFELTKLNFAVCDPNIKSREKYKVFLNMDEENLKNTYKEQ